MLATRLPPCVQNDAANDAAHSVFLIRRLGVSIQGPDTNTLSGPGNVVQNTMFATLQLRTILQLPQAFSTWSSFPALWRLLEAFASRKGFVDKKLR